VKVELLDPLRGSNSTKTQQLGRIPRTGPEVKNGSSIKHRRGSDHERRQRGRGPLDDTDKVEGGLLVLFFGFVFSVAPLEIFLPTHNPRGGELDPVDDVEERVGGH